MKLEKYEVKVEMSMLPEDADLTALIPGFIKSRFEGTAIRVGSISVTKQEKAE